MTDTDLLELLKKISSDLEKNSRDTALMKQAILGNGVKGLAERMDDLENWLGTHPRVCPLEAPPNPRRVNVWVIFFGIVGVVGVFGSLAVAVFK